MQKRMLEKVDKAANQTHQSLIAKHVLLLWTIDQPMQILCLMKRKRFLIIVCALDGRARFLNSSPGRLPNIFGRKVGIKRGFPPLRGDGISERQRHFQQRLSNGRHFPHGFQSLTLDFYTVDGGRMYGRGRAEDGPRTPGGS